MMDTLKNKVKKELDNIAEKGLTSSNLEATNKLVDIYKDLCEIEGGESKMYDERYWDDRYRDDRYRNDRYNERGHRSYNDKVDRHLEDMRDGYETYNAGRRRYMDGGSNEKMLEGVEMAMNSVTKFIEFFMDNAEGQQEKDIVRKYINRIKNV